MSLEKSSFGDEGWESVELERFSWLEGWLGL